MGTKIIFTPLSTTTVETTAAENAQAVKDAENGLIESNHYVTKRLAEYPQIVDQLDDIYHNGIDAWKATIKVTKDKYPKR